MTTISNSPHWRSGETSGPSWMAPLTGVASFVPVLARCALDGLKIEHH